MSEDNVFDLRKTLSIWCGGLLNLFKNVCFSHTLRRQILKHDVSLWDFGFFFAFSPQLLHKPKTNKNNLSALHASGHIAKGIQLPRLKFCVHSLFYTHVQSVVSDCLTTSSPCNMSLGTRTSSIQRKCERFCFRSVY